jgi:hypothetical protein
MRVLIVSGYEKGPEYGGPDPSWMEAALLAVVMGLVTAVLLWLTA